MKRLPDRKWINARQERRAVVAAYFKDVFRRESISGQQFCDHRCVNCTYVSMGRDVQRMGRTGKLLPDIFAHRSGSETE